jgi:hypothetical protein
MSGFPDPRGRVELDPSGHRSAGFERFGDLMGVAMGQVQDAAGDERRRAVGDTSQSLTETNATGVEAETVSSTLG